VVVSHAHLDPIGRLPLQRGYRGLIYMTRATARWLAALQAIRRQS